MNGFNKILEDEFILEEDNLTKTADAIMNSIRNLTPQYLDDETTLSRAEGSTLDMIIINIIPNEVTDEVINEFSAIIKDVNYPGYKGTFRFEDQPNSPYLYAEFKKIN